MDKVSSISSFFTLATLCSLQKNITNINIIINIISFVGVLMAICFLRSYNAEIFKYTILGKLINQNTIFRCFFEN